MIRSIKIPPLLKVVTKRSKFLWPQTLPLIADFTLTWITKFNSLTGFKPKFKWIYLFVLSLVNGLSCRGHIWEVRRRRWLIRLRFPGPNTDNININSLCQKGLDSPNSALTVKPFFIILLFLLYYSSKVYFVITLYNFRHTVIIQRKTPHS